MKTKICTECKKEYPPTLEYFYKEPRDSKYGLYAKCKKCHCEITKEYEKVWSQTTDGKKSKRRRNSKYFLTEKGKLARRKHWAKTRNKGFRPLFENPFSDEEEIEWHHIDDSEYVVALPRDIHRLYHPGYGYHKEMCFYILQQIYGKNYDREEEEEI